MSEVLIIASAQINPVVGDIAGNVERIRAARAKAALEQADLVVFPELTLSGYPPEDLVLKQAFLDAIQQAAHGLAAETADGGPAMMIGAPWVLNGQCHNGVLLLTEGRIAAVQGKVHLPNYGVFDEQRVFTAAPLPEPIMFRGVALGVMICEDMWHDDVARHLAQNGAEILVVPNGSPFDANKGTARQHQARQRIQETGLPLLYVNQWGGQDELVFDGGSFAMDRHGAIVLRLPDWDDAIVVSEWTKQAMGWTTHGPLTPDASRLSALYHAMMIGLRDYIRKNGFPGVILGLSGGIDSALAAALAVDALGADKVWCVMMPSPYTSQDSLDDAAAVATLLGCRLDTLSIAPAMAAFDTMLASAFTGTTPDITEENLQSRSRGLALMALSNKFGPMVLSTGNKSEMSTGYATLYGDMCGGFAVLKDVYKTDVFAVCRWRNAHLPSTALGPSGPVMPDRVITKPPSAELKPDQKDQDTLPAYDILDGILECLIEGELGVEQTVAKGYDEATVRRVWRMLDRAEYKRRQAPPGVKITGRSFGKDRRYPITNGFTRTI